jgi:hypothetical protein
MAVVFWLLFGFIIGTIAGISAGLIFALILAIFEYIISRRFAFVKQEMSKRLEILYDDSANRFKGKEAVGGWLFLTIEEIIFKPHGLNMQNQEAVIPLNTILEISKVNTLGIIPNGILIKTSENDVERFVVNNRKIWIQRIMQARKV